MDTAQIIAFVQEIVYFLVVFGGFIGLGLAKGRLVQMHVILALYLGLLFSLQFPYFENVLNIAGSANPQTESILKIILFVVFAAGAFLLLKRIGGHDYDEKPHEGLATKTLLAAVSTVLVMAFSFHVLPITEFITPGAPLQTLFAPAEHFFWWLLLPIAALFII